MFRLVALLALGGFVIMLKNSSQARGIRNNNPGNLVITNIQWNGKVPEEQNTDRQFEQFYSAHYGLRAMFMDIRGDVEKDGLNTVQKLITEYAPANENDTAAYIASVSRQIGKAAVEPIDSQDYLPLMRAIIRHENGEQPYSSAEILQAMAAA